MEKRKYKCNRSLGYGIMTNKQPQIDTESEYYIVGSASAFDNRMIIERVDGEEFEGEKRWIVDNHNLAEI
ncbi:hypothetical protein [Halalkalibacter oceani]|uniref:hypothetical protein n=1 Tax=Halalkalibacter oceani TaxID=1653776 RepID=UPI0033983758